MNSGWNTATHSRSTGAGRRLFFAKADLAPEVLYV